MGLTARQTRFVEEYAVSGNAASAARVAGYSQRTARQIASENLTKPDIVAAIAQKKQAEAQQLGLRKEHILAAILGAIDMASARGNPSVMVTGWREIGRLCGFYEPASTATKPLSARAQRVKERFEAMSTNELLEFVAAKGQRKNL